MPSFLVNALIAGTFVAVACGVGGWFVVLRGEIFAGDALSHVAFPGALAAASFGLDARVGLFAATVLAGVAMGTLLRAGNMAQPGALAAQGEAAIGIVFTFTLGLGAFFLARLGMSDGAGAGAGIAGARTLFGSLFGLGSGEALVAAAGCIGATLALLMLARPLLFASTSPDVAAAMGVRTRVLGVAFLAILGVVAACGTQAVGALLVLALLAAPAASAHRLARGPVAGAALAAGLAVAAMWSGIALAYAIPSLPPSSAVATSAVAIHVLAAVAR